MQNVILVYLLANAAMPAFRSQVGNVTWCGRHLKNEMRAINVSVENLIRPWIGEDSLKDDEIDGYSFIFCFAFYINFFKSRSSVNFSSQVREGSDLRYVSTRVTYASMDSE